MEHAVEGWSWRKSSYSSGNGECVEMAPKPDGHIAVRDTKANGKGPILTFTRAEMAAFIAGAKAGEFDHLT